MASQLIANATKRSGCHPSSKQLLSILRNSKSFRSSSFTASRSHYGGGGSDINLSALVVGLGAFGCAAYSASIPEYRPYLNTSSAMTTTTCDASQKRKKSSGVLMLGPTKEPSTGILFPQLCNGMTFVGCGVRVKYGFVKVSSIVRLFT